MTISKETCYNLLVINEPKNRIPLMFCSRDGQQLLGQFLIRPSALMNSLLLRELIWLESNSGRLITAAGIQTAAVNFSHTLELMQNLELCWVKSMKQVSNLEKRADVFEKVWKMIRATSKTFWGLRIIEIFFLRIFENGPFKTWF